MRAASSSTRCACSTTCVPVGVTDHLAGAALEQRMPSSSSSFLIATDSVGCETKHDSAARPKCRSRATATM